MDGKTFAEQIFRAAVHSVLPEELIRNEVNLQGSTLYISGVPIPLDNLNAIYVIGAGKASANMAKEIETIIGEKITGGHIIVKYGHGCDLKFIDISEAGHPVPDNNGYVATQKIIGIASRAKEHDLVICLLSGGGSALLTDIPADATIDDIIIANDLLLKSGAHIKEINTIRKHLSKVKGGQLAKTVYPATLVSLILSDVIGDSPDTIASGPTAPDTTSFKDALAIIGKYDLESKFPEILVNHLEKGALGDYDETPKPGDVVFENTRNIIIGSNKIALEAASQKAIELGISPLTITSEMQGETTDIAGCLVAIAITFQTDANIKKPCCLLFGGETTIKVSGDGSGGRNQHLALYAASLLKGKNGITLLSAGTDGTDGPTAAAGAVVDTKTFGQALTHGMDIDNYLQNFDSFHFFENAGGHIITGPTMTNVMDMVVIIIE